MTAPSDLREYEVSARSTDTPGRVMCSARNHHIIVDGPTQNGFLGEEITPSELFLQAVAACGVELVQMLAARQFHSIRRNTPRPVPLSAIDCGRPDGCRDRWYRPICRGLPPPL